MVKKPSSVASLSFYILSILVYVCSRSSSFGSLIQINNYTDCCTDVFGNSCESLTQVSYLQETENIIDKRLLQE